MVFQHNADLNSSTHASLTVSHLGEEEYMYIIDLIGKLKD